MKRFARLRPRSKKRRAWWRHLKKRRRNGLAVVSLGSKMIDPPVVQRALKLVERAKAMGAIS